MMLRLLNTSAGLGSIPIDDADSQTPAHWSVTFGVDDANSTAAKAKKLYC